MKKVLPRILYGFLSSSSNPINISMPWSHSDKDGLFKMNYSTIRAEYDNLKCWALTNKGERVMNSDFGLDAARYLFDPIPLAKDNLLNNARKQLEKYFSHLQILDINFLFFDDDSSLRENQTRLIIKARIKSTQEVVDFNEQLGEAN